MIMSDIMHVLDSHSLAVHTEHKVSQGTQLQEYKVPNARNKGTVSEYFACCCQESIGRHLRFM